MRRMYTIANSLLWAAAILSSAVLHAPWLLTLIILPCLAATAVVLVPAKQPGSAASPAPPQGPDAA